MRRGSRASHLAHLLRDLGRMSWTERKAVKTAVKMGAFLKTFGENLTAVGVYKGWLSHAIQPADVPINLIMSMEQKLASYYQQPRKGDFDQQTLCRLVRVVTWMVDEIKDDLLAFKCSYGAHDPLRGAVFRYHFGADWSKQQSTIFENFKFSFKGGKDYPAFKDPMMALINCVVGVNPKKAPKTKNIQGGDSSIDGTQNANMDERSGAFVKTWFAGLPILTTTREERERHTVFKHQPTPFENVTSLGCLSFQCRAALKLRCVEICGAITRNIGLLRAEIEACAASSSPQSSNQGSPTSHLEMVMETWKGRKKDAQGIQRSGSREVSDKAERLRDDITFLQTVQERLQDDGEVIRKLFHEDRATDRDVNVLLFYSNLRAHAWSDRWYGSTSQVIRKEIGLRSLEVMRKALNIGPAPL